MLKDLRAFFLRDGFLARANLLELAVGIFVITSLQASLESFARDLLSPILYSLGGIPDLSFLRPFGIAIGSFVTMLLTLLIRVAAIYFLIVLPLNRLARKAPSNE